MVQLCDRDSRKDGHMYSIRVWKERANKFPKPPICGSRQEDKEEETQVTCSRWSPLHGWQGCPTRTQSPARGHLPPHRPASPAHPALPAVRLSGMRLHQCTIDARTSEGAGRGEGTLIAANNSSIKFPLDGSRNVGDSTAMYRQDKLTLVGCKGKQACMKRTLGMNSSGVCHCLVQKHTVPAAKKPSQYGAHAFVPVLRKRGILTTPVTSLTHNKGRTYHKN